MPSLALFPALPPSLCHALAAFCSFGGVCRGIAAVSLLPSAAPTSHRAAVAADSRRALPQLIFIWSTSSHRFPDWSHGVLVQGLQYGGRDSLGITGGGRFRHVVLPGGGGGG